MRNVVVILLIGVILNHFAGCQLLEACPRIFRHLDDDKATQKVQSIIETVDEQFHPGETAMQVYVRLLNSNIDNQ